MDNKTHVDNFLTLYEHDERLKALQSLIDSFDVRYDERVIEDGSLDAQALKLLMNVADASVFFGRSDAVCPFHALKLFSEANPGYKHLLSGFMEQYTHEDFLLDLAHKTVQPFVYPGKPSPFTYGDREDVAVVFLQPYADFDYAAFLMPYRNKKLILVCDSQIMLQHLSELPSFHAFKEDPTLTLYTLDTYPSELFVPDTTPWAPSSKIQFVFMCKQTAYEPYLSAFEKALINYFSQQERSKQDNPDADWLYAVAKRMTRNAIAWRLGHERSLALNHFYGILDWNSPHKGKPADHLDIGPEPKNDFFTDLTIWSAERQPREYAPERKIKIAHIATQLVAYGHAPSDLITALCVNADQNWFDVFFLSSDKFTNHFFNYPHSAFGSDSSLLRGSLLLQLFQEVGVHAQVNTSLVSFNKTVDEILDNLELHKIDIVVLHGPDEIHSAVSARTKVPIRILIDHGTIPSVGSYDLAILSSDQSYNMHAERLRSQGIECCTLPFAVDFRGFWPAEAAALDELGIPQDSFVMTTISNHLDHRVGAGMVQVIGRILQKYPHVVYAPIGPLHSVEEFIKRFESFGVENRVIPLGTRLNPRQYVKAMHLYLNEFPFGGGLAILEAMAAGCPVVSMDDESGPPQGRYGATYFGDEWVIKSCNPDDYFNLACQLIENSEMRRTWSEHALERYENFSDINLYVRRFEKIIELFIPFMAAKSRFE